MNDFLHSEDYAAPITCQVLVSCRGVYILVGGRLTDERNYNKQKKKPMRIELVH